MNKANYFEREITLIKNEDYRKFIEHYLNNVCPNYFWEIGASSSGKYHPQFSQGEGGLVRHTKAVVMFAEELLRMSSYMYMSDEHKDYVIMACIVHDTCKYGQSEFNKELYKDHAKNASALVNEAWYDYFGINASEFFLSAIKCHMGQWSEREDRPFTNIDRCVHMADYMASRSFIDIPQVVEEYQAVTCEPNNEHCYMCSQLQSCNYIKAVKTRECGKGA
jgi:HD superfamily phosphohydrolase YqeK